MRRGAAPPTRPRVLLNCAASLDGRLARPDGTPLRLSDDEDLRRVHRMRAACDAILVGVGTVVADDPSLRVKPGYAEGGDPLRVVLDPDGRTPPTARVLDGGSPTVLVVAEGVPERDGVDMLRVPRAPGGLELDAVLAALAARAVGSVMVEGGARVLGSFLGHGAWDEWTLYVAPVLVGGDGPALPAPGEGRGGFRVVDAHRQGEGVLWTFRPTPAGGT